MHLARTADVEDACVLLKGRDDVLIDVPLREPFEQPLGVEFLENMPVRAQRAPVVLHRFHTRRPGDGDVESSGKEHKLLPALRFELCPVLIGKCGQSAIRVVVVAVTDDPRVILRRAMPWPSSNCSIASTSVCPCSVSQ